jgi:hypothetical protein
MIRRIGAQRYWPFRTGPRHGSGQLEAFERALRLGAA